jgi:hypothetical protein
MVNIIRGKNLRALRKSNKGKKNIIITLLRIEIIGLKD